MYVLLCMTCNKNNTIIVEIIIISIIINNVII